MGLVNHCEMVGFLVKIVNVEKCFEIVFTNRKNINTFAPKLGLWFNKMDLLQFFIFDIYVPGDKTLAAGDAISHSRDYKAKSIDCTPLLEQSI